MKIPPPRSSAKLGDAFKATGASICSASNEVGFSVSLTLPPPQPAQTYGIRAFPTLLFFKKGKVVDQLVGAVPMSKLEERILNAL